MKTALSLIAKALRIFDSMMTERLDTIDEKLSSIETGIQDILRELSNRNDEDEQFRRTTNERLREVEGEIRARRPQ